MRAAQVERARQGDHAAFAALVDADGDRCYAIAFRILRDVEAARDAVQQAFLLAWRELPGLREIDRYEAWLHRLLVNACYEESKRRRRWTAHIRVLPIEGPAGPDPTLTIEDRDLLDRAFARLTPEHRAVVVLHHYAGMPLATVAEVVGVPLGTVKSRLHHATASMRAAVAIDSILEPASPRSA